MVRYEGGLIRRAGKRFRISLGLALLLVVLVTLAIGCGVQDLRRAHNSQYPRDVRWAAANTSPLLSNAHYFKLMGRPELALKELEEAHREAPANLKVANVLAQSYDDLGLGQRAPQVYREALAVDPAKPVFNGRRPTFNRELCYNDWDKIV